MNVPSAVARISPVRASLTWAAVRLARQLLHEQRHHRRFAGSGIAADLDPAGAVIEEHVEIQKFCTAHEVGSFAP